MNTTPQAFCHSERCSGTKYGTSPALKTDVRLTADKCPDCGSYLTWGRGRRAISHQARTKNKHTKAPTGERIYDWR